jgi:hypothetical protein
MTNTRTDWVVVDLDGLRKLLERRGKVFAIYELVQNAWDEKTTQVEIALSRPISGRSTLSVIDDSPDGFLDLTASYTMYAESYKKSDPNKRGAFNLGEKFVLALCDEATITSTSGQVVFSKDGRKRTRSRRPAGTEFRGSLRLTLAEYEQILKEIQYLIPPVPTFINGTVLLTRTCLREFNATLPTVIADEEGRMRPTKRNTQVRIYTPLPGETPMLYEMGIPVVETGDTWHVDICQKVPLNMERDNITPAFLSAVRVAVLNEMAGHLDAKLAVEPWVRAAGSSPLCASDTTHRLMDLRYGSNRVSFDPSDIGSNREAASKGFTVIAGGSLSAGEWDNVRKHRAIQPAGQMFSTNLDGKIPDKVFTRDEWTPAMAAYAEFVEQVSPTLVGYEVTVRYLEDSAMVCGEFFDSYFDVNLAHLNVSDWQANVELMLHELAHTVVRSNLHLHHLFYETVGKLGAALAILVARNQPLARSIA